ncbi:MAG: signal peptidase I [Clostridia bacterium]|nr:signal peptidase I [Clostridia bacterium]
MEWISSIFIALIVAILISIFVIQPSSVFGHSMEPTLNEGDWVIISRLPNTLSMDYDYEDIVIIDSNVSKKHTKIDDFLFIFKYNGLTNYLFDQQPIERYWIKRIIGKAGDTISFIDGEVYRNGHKLDEPYIKEGVTYAPFPSIKVPENTVFVLGDNRNNSGDSRILGPIPIENVLGKMIYSF